MSTPIWPDTLPDVIQPGYELSPVDQSRRTDMEVGHARLRRITKARADDVGVAWKFTDAEMTAFRAWHGDEPWSLSGDSDDLTSWTTFNANVTGDALTGPAGQLADRIIETTDTETHRISKTLSTVLDNQVVSLCATLKANGRTEARLTLIDRAGTLRYTVIDLSDGTLSNPSNILSSAVVNRGNGWWRVIITADAGSGGSDPKARISLLDGGGAASYTGDGVSGVDVCEFNTRLRSGYDLCLPTDTNGDVRGAAGGSGWFQIPLAFGGGFKTAEARFKEPFKARILSGLGWHVTSRLEVRNA